MTISGGISAVLLAYHEEKVIEQNIKTVMEQLEALSTSVEVIVVGYEGAKDRTNVIVEELANKDSRIRLVIQKKTEKGYGRAFAIGVKAARLEWIFQTDADGQYDFACIPNLFNEVINTPIPDVVHGFRAPRKDPIERLVFAFLYNFALRRLYSLPIKDVDSAFKIIRKSKLDQIELKSLSGFAVAECIVKLQRLGCLFRQIPIIHLPRTEGEALSEKGIKNPFGLQIPNRQLVFETLNEMWRFRFKA